jgi:hypothetical protein
MTRDEALKALEDVADAMHSQHDDDRGRLSQLDSHIATAQMVIGHLFDDADNSAASKEG